MSGILTTIITAIVSAVVGVVVGAAVKGIKTTHKRNEAVRRGLQSILRGEIIKQHEKYMEKEFCPVYAKDAIRRQYESYHELGGNGVITELYHEIMALPELQRKTGGQ